MASLGEETRMSTRGPANHNAVALILPHKAMLGFDGGAIGADIYCDRTGILCRTLDDCATVLDALKDPEQGYYDPRDPYTTVPRSSVLERYSEHLSPGGEAGALRGIRLGVVRESMLSAGSKAAEPITQAAAREVQAVLAEHLGATLVESRDPLWTPDARCEAMKVDFRTALARLVPVFMPELLFRLNAEGQPVFPDFAAQIERTEFAPGVFHGSGQMTPMDYLVALTDGLIAPPSNLDVSTVQQQILANSFRYHISQYLSRRAIDWAALGQTETLRDWRSLNERSKFWGDDQRSAFLNWEEVRDPRNPLGGRQGVDERIMLRELLRRVDMMVSGMNLPGIPNGIAFAPDYRKLYLVTNGLIHSFDLSADNKVSNQKEFSTMMVDGVQCRTDGIRVDVNGNLWCGSNAGRTLGYSGVTVWSPEAKLLGRIRLPETCANLCFGGPKRNRLFMTAGQSLYAVYVATQGASPG